MRSLETNISKNSCFHREESFWPIFPRIIECARPQGTIYKSSQGGFSDNYCGSHMINSIGPKMLLKTQIFEKKAIFPVKKDFDLFFLVLSSAKSLKGQFVNVQKVF